MYAMTSEKKNISYPNFMNGFLRTCTSRLSISFIIINLHNLVNGMFQLSKTTSVEETKEKKNIQKIQNTKTKKH